LAEQKITTILLALITNLPYLNRGQNNNKKKHVMLLTFNVNVYLPARTEDNQIISTWC